MISMLNIDTLFPCIKAYINVAVHHCSKPGDISAFAPEYLALLPHYFTKWL